jgi:2',3'-cyclic-nucleotide 2'-phosphodiesterase (5'-nucleotidase family)
MYKGIKTSWIIYLVCIGWLACKPAQTRLEYAASYAGVSEETENARLNTLIAPYKAKVDSEMNEVIGFSEVEMPKVKDQPETVLGNFVADLVLEFARSMDAETDFVVLNNGGLRSSMPAGNITIRNVFELMPFDNEIVIVSLGGNEVSRLLGYIAERKGIPVAGIRIQLEKMNGNLVAGDVKIKGLKFSANTTYKIATSDYLSGGGDGMNFWGTGTIQKTGKKIRDAIIDFIRLKTAAHQTLLPVLDQRIMMLN